MKKNGNNKSHITSEQLAERWSLSPGTVENWRNLKKGPKFIKLGHGISALVRYRISDIEAYEKKMESK